jgi:hypothetical protein
MRDDAMNALQIYYSPYYFDRDDAVNALQSFIVDARPKLSQGSNYT